MGARLVVGHKRDGRCVYDAQAKQELVLACRESGVSISKVAREFSADFRSVTGLVWAGDAAEVVALPSKWWRRAASGNGFAPRDWGPQ